MAKKYLFINKQTLPTSFDYLGYKIHLFENQNKLEFELGISSLLKTLFKEKLKKIISENKENTEKLRNLIKLHTRRFVYEKQIEEKKTHFFSVSLTQNRKLLRKYKNKLNKEDVLFLQNAVIDCFKELPLPLPYYLKDNNMMSAYNLYGNLMRNSALVLKPNLTSKEKLLEIVKNISEDDLTNNDYKTISNFLTNKIKQGK